MTIGERLKQIRIAKGMTQQDVANAIGTTYQNISQYERGVRTPKMSTVHKLATVLGVGAWEIAGWGDEVEVDEFMDWDDIDAFKKGFEQNRVPANAIKIRRVKVPLLGNIAAGEPIFADEVFEEYVEAEEDIRCDFALRVAGDSMMPTVQLGDLVFIRQQNDVSDGEIAAVLIDESATLKRVFHIKDGLALNSDNSVKYPPMIFTYPECDTIRILGKAVAFKRYL